jgi:hypothetical protein
LLVEESLLLEASLVHFFRQGQLSLVVLVILIR